MANIDDSLVDKRIVERNIQKGMLTRDDHIKYIGKLPDRAENAEAVSFEEEE